MTDEHSHETLLLFVPNMQPDIEPTLFLTGKQVLYYHQVASSANENHGFIEMAKKYKIGEQCTLSIGAQFSVQ